MSDQVIPSQLPESLSFTIREVIPGLENVLIQATENRADVIEVFIDSIQEKIDEHLEKVAQYYFDQIQTAAPVTETAYDRAVRGSDAIREIMTQGRDSKTEINIYEARSSKGNYRGEVIYIDDEVAAQKVSEESVILHELSILNQSPPVGQSVQIKYDAGVGLVSEWSPSPQKTTEATEAVAPQPDPTPTAQSNIPEPAALEAAKAFINNLDADAKISEPRLNKGNYKGSVLTDIDGYVVQQLGDHSYVIHDLTNITSSSHAIVQGTEHKFRFIYQNGKGSVEQVALEATADYLTSKPMAATPAPENKTPETNSGSTGVPNEDTRRLEAYEAARASISLLHADAKISEVRLDKGSYKGSVLGVANGYAIQQIGDKSFVIHDLAVLEPGANESSLIASNIGVEHKLRFIYKDGQGTVEKVDLATEAKKEPAKKEDAPPSPTPPDPNQEIKTRLYQEAASVAMQRFETVAAEATKAGKPVKAPMLYAARTADTANTKGELVVVNNGFVIQKIGNTTGVVHDRANIDTSLNLKTITGPVALTYQDGKASVEQLPHDYWKTNERRAVNRAFSGQPNTAPSPASVNETTNDRG